MIKTGSHSVAQVVLKSRQSLCLNLLSMGTIGVSHCAQLLGVTRVSHCAQLMGVVRVSHCVYLMGVIEVSHKVSHWIKE